MPTQKNYYQVYQFVNQKNTIKTTTKVGLCTNSTRINNLKKAFARVLPNEAGYQLVFRVIVTNGPKT